MDGLQSHPAPCPCSTLKAHLGKGSGAGGQTANDTVRELVIERALGGMTAVVVQLIPQVCHGACLRA